MRDYVQEEKMEKARWAGMTTAGIVCAAILVSLSLWGCPKYSVWEKGMAGRGELAQAEFNRRIKIQEAEATLSSSSLLAKAEIERAKGVAEANKIIGHSLQDNEQYLRYLWIHNLEAVEKNGTVVYVPTEAGLPILEAGKRK